METATCELPMAGLDLRTTMMLQRLGRHDPTAHEATGLFEKRHLRTDGAVAFTRIQTDPETCRVTVEGQGAANEVDAWRLALMAVPKWPALPEDARLVRRLGASYPGMRILRMPWVFDVAISCVLQQRVRFVDAVRDYGRIAKQLAPPEVEAPVLPHPARLAETPLYELQSLGIDAQRGRALITLAREVARRDFLATDEAEQVRARLLHLPGIGAWTTEMLMGFGLGDPDAVPLQDLHLPKIVTAAFGAQGPADDAHMLELLEPFRGQRFRVIRLLWAAGYGSQAALRRLRR